MPRLTVLSAFLTSTYDANSLSPQGIAYDPFDDSLWVTDNISDKIYNITKNGQLITSFSISTFDMNADNIQGISVDLVNFSLWVTDRSTNKVYNISRNGNLISFFPSTSFDPSAQDLSGVAFEGQSFPTGPICIVVGTVVDVKTTDYGNSKDHEIDVRSGSLENHYYFAFTEDDDIGKAASKALRSQIPVRLKANGVPCPTNGTARDIGEVLLFSIQ